MSIRIVLACVAIVLFQGGVMGESGYVVMDVENPEFRPSRVFFKFEDISSSSFKELRREFNLKKVVKGIDDEFDRILALRSWIFKRLKQDYSKPAPPQEAVAILKMGPTGGPFECHYTMLAQNGVMNSMGYVTRCLQAGPGGEANSYLDSGNHGVNEIWSNKYRKWFVSDSEFDGHFEKDGVPLSALEIRREYLKNKAKDVDCVVGPERKKVEPHRLFAPYCYQFVGYELTGDRETRSGFSSSAMVVLDDAHFQKNIWHRWKAPKGGKAKPHWAYKADHFMRIRNGKWINWTPNVIKVRAKIDGNVVHIKLRSNTPNLKRLEMSSDGKRWKKAASRFDLKLKGDRIEWQFRSVNTAGVTGPVSRLVIEK